MDSNEIWVDAKASSGTIVFSAAAAGLGRSKKSIPGRISSMSSCSTATATASTGAIRRTFSRRSTITRFRRARRKVVHYSFTVPEDAGATVTFEAKLQYRKFDTIYMNYVFGKGY